MKENFFRRYYIKVKENKNFRVLIENFLSLSIIQVVNLILPLVTLPYIIRVLGFSNYGIVAIALSLNGYFTPIVDYSFRITATRDVSIHRYNKKALDFIYSKVMTIKLLFFIISYLLILLITYSYPSFYNHKETFAIISISLLGGALFPEWFFQGIEKMKFITLVNVFVRIFYTASIFLFIKNDGDLLIYALLLAGSSVLTGLLGQLILFIQFKIKFILLKPQRLSKSLRNNFPIFINQVFPLLYNNSTTFILAFFVSESLIGVYAATRKIVDISVVLLNIVSRVFFPFLNKQKEYFSNYKNLMLILSGIGAFLLLISYPILFWILNITEPIAFYVHLLLSLSIMGYVLYDIYGLNYLIVHKQDKIVMKNTIIMSCIGFSILIPLISYLGIIGAALTILISRFLMGIGVYFKAKIYKKSIAQN